MEIEIRLDDIFVVSYKLVSKRNNKAEYEEYKEYIEFFYKCNRIFGIVPERNDGCCVIA